MPDIHYLDQGSSVQSGILFFNLCCEPGNCEGNLPDIYDATVVFTVVKDVMLEGNTPEFSTSVQDSIHVLLVMLSLLFSVEVQIPDNRNADVGVGTNAGLSVDVCIVYISNPKQQPGRSVVPVLE